MNVDTILRPVVVALVGLAAGVVGCGGSADAPFDGPIESDQLATVDQGIKNGKVDRKHDHVVGMVMRRSGGLGMCTGTLVAPNVVLTARHCIASLSDRNRILCGQTTFEGAYPASSVIVSTGTDLRKAIENGKYQRVEKIHVPPGGDGVCGRDIAMMRLTENVPSDTAEPTKPRLTEPVHKGETYTAFGYGRTNGTAGRAGIRRKRAERTVRCRGGNCGHGSIADREFFGSGGPCQGDSGGGAFDSKDRVLGVASRANGSCSFTLYSSVYPWRGWIRGVVQRAATDGGYDVPEWAKPRADSDGDGIGDPTDSCPGQKNPKQTDTDDDGKGNACDPDDDGDGVRDPTDPCPTEASKSPGDLDSDGKGNVCDPDIDGDRAENEHDNCPRTPNPDQTISDADGSGDACDDSDGDGVLDRRDNCLETPNAGQSDSDGDGRGDACTASNSPDEPVVLVQNDRGSSGCTTTGSTPPPAGLALILLLGCAGAGRRRRFDPSQM